MDHEFSIAIETLDRSALPEGFRDSLADEQVILLTEIMARILMPELVEIPDLEEMNKQSLERWFVPNTRIEIRLIKDGPRSGEYLFSAQTVLDIWATHQKVKNLPKLSGVVNDFYESLPSNAADLSILEIKNISGIGFSGLPERWLLKLPNWLRAKLIGVPVWKWLNLVAFCFLIWAGLVVLRKGLFGAGLKDDWRQVANYSALAIFAGLSVWFLDELRFGGAALVSLSTLGIVGLYLAMSAAVYLGSGVLAEKSINRRQLTETEIDSQLVRFVARLIGIIIAVLLIIQGANQIGLPAYSIVSGLGIGAFAFAIAAKEALNNLLGSIIIMFEKPFRNGQWVTVKGVSGTVEKVGFRSTWLRTSSDSLTSIPNGAVSNDIIDNLGVRGKRRQQFSVYFPHTTSNVLLEALIQGIWKIIDTKETTDSSDINVRLHNIGHDGLEIYLHFFLTVSSYATEQKEREEILLEILELARNIGVDLSYPTQTVHIADHRQGKHD